MKKINLFFSTLIVALVLLVAGGATIAPAMQLRTMSLNTASAGADDVTTLFDNKGRYTIDRTDLAVNSFYQFFGYDWRLVKVNGNVATFWMATPYAKTSFNQTYRSANGIFKDGSNIWVNGYTKTVWKSEIYTENAEIEIAQSDIRKYLNSAAKTIIDNKVYAKYKSKVIGGAVDGSNGSNDDAKTVVEKLAYSKDSVDQVEELTTPTNQLTAYYGLDSTDRLWLPSIGDLRAWGILNSDSTVANANALKWTETTISNRAWLRNGSYTNSEYALVISSDAEKVGDEAEAGYIHAKAIKQEAGVRPAIHLDISNITAEYEAHLKNSSTKGSWWDDDWLKALFMTVCIIGIVGIALVIVAVIVKARNTNNQAE